MFRARSWLTVFFHEDAQGCPLLWDRGLCRVWATACHAPAPGVSGVGGDYATVSDNGDADDQEFLTYYLCDGCWNKLPVQ
jgi:hypothetical protein